MIFGSIEFQKELLGKIREIEIRENITVVYIGTVGSISRGLSDAKSDYDVKCLFIRNDAFIEDSMRHDEEKIRFREFDDEKVYECIAFWEISAFFNFLAEPFIDSGEKYDLWRNVMWLLMTPYSWDPLGIKEKIRWDLEACIDIENELIYHLNLISKLMKTNSDINKREATRLLHAYLSIQWIVENQSVPPVNILSLLSTVSDERVKEYYIEIIANDDRFIEKDTYCRLIDNVTTLYNQMTEGYKNKEYDFSALSNNRKHVDNILDIILQSLKTITLVEDLGLYSYHDTCLEKMF